MPIPAVDSYAVSTLGQARGKLFRECFESAVPGGNPTGTENRDPHDLPGRNPEFRLLDSGFRTLNASLASGCFGASQGARGSLRFHGLAHRRVAEPTRDVVVVDALAVHD